jgi:hypothetical protein
MKNTIPEYLSDAPLNLQNLVAAMAEVSEVSIRNVFAAEYPDLNMDSREALELMAATFHIAEQRCLDRIR